MGSVNKAILVGNLGRDAEMRFTASGTPVATVSLATTERFTDREGQRREDTQWHRIVIWGKTLDGKAEIRGYNGDQGDWVVLVLDVSWSMTTDSP